MRHVNILIIAAAALAVPLALAAHVHSTADPGGPRASGLLHHIADHAAALHDAAQPSPGQPTPGQPSAAPPTTADLQGSDAWRRDPHIRTFYDTVKAAFANGPDKVDSADLEARSFVIFRDFAVSKGMNPDAMQDHLKLIPRQMIKVVREDPSVLASYDTFADALFGPR